MKGAVGPIGPAGYNGPVGEQGEKVMIVVGCCRRFVVCSYFCCGHLMTSIFFNGRVSLDQVGLKAPK